MCLKQCVNITSIVTWSCVWPLRLQTLPHSLVLHTCGVKKHYGDKIITWILMCKYVQKFGFCYSLHLSLTLIKRQQDNLHVLYF